MKNKTKALTWKIAKIIWFIIGGFILFWTIFFFIKMHTIQSLGVIGTALLFGVGLYTLVIFIVITLLFLLIKWLIKKFHRTNG
ncbi:hypothetical protein ES705_15133 [subsurface metagenome]